MVTDFGMTRYPLRKTLNISIGKMFYGIDMDTVTVSPKFQVVIPQSVRERVGIKPGERMIVMERGNVIYLVRIGEIKDAKGFLGKKISTKGLRDESERFG
jgi:AbrB family looped-hinge helix DNA binding protein